MRFVETVLKAPTSRPIVLRLTAAGAPVCMSIGGPAAVGRGVAMGGGVMAAVGAVRERPYRHHRPCRGR